MKRPANYAYWQDDAPPLAVMFFSALQHVGLVCSFLPIPLAIAREAGVNAQGLIDLISVSMLALGATAFLQSLNRGGVGSGLLAPSCFSAAYLAPSLLAVRTGGMALALGMTMFGGFVEMCLSRVLKYLRPFLPPEIAGFVVVLVGLSVGSLGVRFVLGVGAPTPATFREFTVAAITLGLMVGLCVWGRGTARLLCALIGMAGGYLAAASLGVLSAKELKVVMEAPLVAIPAFGTFGWDFDVALIIPFAVGAAASCLKNVGDLTTAQRLNDADFVRPDMASIRRGTLANAIGSAIAGLTGTTGLNSSSANIGVSGATGVTSRYVGYATGALFGVLAFMPNLSGVLALMPRPVMGAALMFVSAFIFVNGLQIVASRLLDVRRTFVIGLSFSFAIAVDISPAYFNALSPVVQPLVGNSLVAGMICAVLLNLVFRIGTRKQQRLEVPAGQVDLDALEAFMDSCGASWGARRDVVQRAKYNLQQSIDTILSSGVAAGALEVTAWFDDFNVVVRVSYEGPPLELPEIRPTVDEVLETEEGERRLAGYMLRRFADRVTGTQKNGRATMVFRFVH
ncbi:MAG: solute carrier family 23 protein [Betaproteobacteria bacterium]